MEYPVTYLLNVAPRNSRQYSLGKPGDSELRIGKNVEGSKMAQ
jgi:hypothetical protein